MKDELLIILRRVKVNRARWKRNGCRFTGVCGDELARPIITDELCKRREVSPGEHRWHSSAPSVA